MDEEEIYQVYGNQKGFINLKINLIRPDLNSKSTNIHLILIDL